MILLAFYFNPRSDERSDDDLSALVADSLQISIHAPTNGATIMSSYQDNISIFQSTLRRTERLSLYVDAATVYIFQSTLRRTERHNLSEDEQQVRNFNPRSDERSDHDSPL